MPNLWKKEMAEQGYNYLDGSIQHMGEFFETRIENLERFDSKKGFQQEPEHQVQQEKETFQPKCF